MEQKQVLIHKNEKKVLKPKLEYNVKVESVVLDKQKDRCVTVNICNAAEKIEDYPEPIQKLVWRALQYKCEIEARRSMSLVSPTHYEKLTKYIETFRHTQQLILKMCKKRNIVGIIIEGWV